MPNNGIRSHQKHEFIEIKWNTSSVSLSAVCALQRAPWKRVWRIKCPDEHVKITSLTILRFESAVSRGNPNAGGTPGARLISSAAWRFLLHYFQSEKRGLCRGAGRTGTERRSANTTLHKGQFGGVRKPAEAAFRSPSSGSPRTRSPPSRPEEPPAAPRGTGRARAEEPPSPPQGRGGFKQPGGPSSSPTWVFPKQLFPPRPPGGKSRKVAANPHHRSGSAGGPRWAGGPHCTESAGPGRALGCGRRRDGDSACPHVRRHHAPADPWGGELVRGRPRAGGSKAATATGRDGAQWNLPFGVSRGRDSSQGPGINTCAAYLAAAQSSRSRFPQHAAPAPPGHASAVRPADRAPGCRPCGWVRPPTFKPATGFLSAFQLPDGNHRPRGLPNSCIVGRTSGFLWLCEMMQPFWGDCCQNTQSNSSP